MLDFLFNEYVPVEDRMINHFYERADGTFLNYDKEHKTFSECVCDKCSKNMGEGPAMGFSDVGMMDMSSEVLDFLLEEDNEDGEY